MRTVETVPAPAGPTAHEERDLVRHGLRGTAARLAVVLAALLAFGLLGLLVGIWHLKSPRRSADLTCSRCHRRRGLAIAGTFVLAGLVLVGSGMAVHQHVTGPGLPPCSTALPARATADLEDPLVERVGGEWLWARQVLTAPASGFASHYASDRGGGLCRGRSMTVAFLPSAASDATVAVGSVVLTGDHSSMRQAERKALASHESRHVTQWAVLTLTGGPLAMPLLYAVDEAFFPRSRNHFERAADLDAGGYPPPEDFGPRPQWAKVGAMGMLLVIIGGRRLRWGSRVLAGGAAAAVARQPGRCPLHSRGWFRLDVATRQPETANSAHSG